MYRRLGEPLPHLLANTTQVHLLAMQLHLSNLKLVFKVFNESLILAQDERWRRA